MFLHVPVVHLYPPLNTILPWECPTTYPPSLPYIIICLISFISLIFYFLLWTEILEVLMPVSSGTHANVFLEYIPRSGLQGLRLHLYLASQDNARGHSNLLSNRRYMSSHYFKLYQLIEIVRLSNFCLYSRMKEMIYSISSLL